MQRFEKLLQGRFTGGCMILLRPERVQESRKEIERRQRGEYVEEREEEERKQIMALLYLIKLFGYQYCQT